MSTLVVVGAQWGDEGKGKVVDLLASRADFVVRYQGGNNAGHTLVVGGEKTILHLVPSGILQEDAVNVLTQGVVVDAEVLLGELKTLAARGRKVRPGEQLVISPRVALILPYHKALDKAREAKLGGGKIGTTGRGIGPAYEDVSARRAIRLCDALDRGTLEARLARVLDEKNALLSWFGEAPLDRDTLIDELMTLGEGLAPYMSEAAEATVREAIQDDKRVLFEGAQGVLLDVQHGSYPFVTSSSTIAGATTTCVGLPPSAIEQVVAIVKAYTTRVGSGPFPSELEGETGEHLRQAGQEFGSTTGRPRRCGWLDLPLLRYAHATNGFTSLALTKLDVLSGLESVKMCVAYELDGQRYDVLPSADVLGRATPIYASFQGWSHDCRGAQTMDALPQAARDYVSEIERRVGVPVGIIGTGPGRDEVIVRDLSF